MEEDKTLDRPEVQQLLGPGSSVTTCQFCRSSVKTLIKYTSTTRTHVAAGHCYFICCCCCIPFCSKSAKNTDHYCPACKRYLGSYIK